MTAPEPTPFRDLGPYLGHAQARAQYDATGHGIPTPTSEHLSGVSGMVLAEALLLAGVTTSTYEQEQLAMLARQFDPPTVQVVAGWIVRAHLVGAGLQPRPVPEQGDA